MNHASSMDVCLNQVTKRFGERLVLDQVCLQASGGQTVALIGPSGGGKSTLLRCINGLTGFDAGEIRVGSHLLRSTTGRDPGAAAGAMRQLFGMVFQDFQLFPHMTALQNVIEAPVQVLKLSRAEAVERAMSLLERVGLADRADAYPRQLSGGQKQRV